MKDYIYENVLIAERVVGKGDTWNLLNNNKICNSLTDTLEEYFQDNGGANVDFYLSPINGKLYVVNKVVKKVEYKKYNIYGEEI